ncbi:hypothetical protein HII17_13115 [Thalassotalea sp. M1531]|uniref:DUF1579 domain-containing protein n=1 Tax=Thalassotalea algicola TaxID=2716224 RepID=A0A7Y0LDF2_9GAMM|nr:hypothetical protein [Thalassotalea algicola]NMP32503.1 hypothetical protein [Thalassotalea algicola]
MKKYLWILLSCLTLTSNAFADEKKLVKELAVFQDYLGTWTSVFKVQDGKPSVVDVSKWERALNGTTVRTLHSINDGEYGGESLIFFDKTKDKIVFYYFTTAGFYTQGWMEMVDNTTFVAYEDVNGNKDGITQVKSTSKLLGNKMEVSTSYFKNGLWTTPESRIYTRSDKEVKFK